MTDFSTIASAALVRELQERGVLPKPGDRPLPGVGE